MPEMANHATHVYPLFVIRSRHRDALQAFLNAKGIETLVHYPIQLHLQKAHRYLGYRNGQFPITEALAATSLSLPIYPGLQEEQIMLACQAIKRFFSATR